MEHSFGDKRKYDVILEKEDKEDPFPEDTKHLLDMGFTKAAAAHALQKVLAGGASAPPGGLWEAAMEWLLGNEDQIEAIEKAAEAEEKTPKPKAPPKPPRDPLAGAFVLPEPPEDSWLSIAAHPAANKQDGDGTKMQPMAGVLCAAVKLLPHKMDSANQTLAFEVADALAALAEQAGDAVKAMQEAWAASDSAPPSQSLAHCSLLLTQPGCRE